MYSRLRKEKTNRIHEGKQGCLKNNADPEKELRWKNSFGKVSKWVGVKKMLVG